ncbi:MAG: Bax inhibitor-1/YccA family protein [Propionibacteriaceae bacterium]|nr:Bax inhibitor-1/YccA family protein [Propionibacteriaceae bacterium]
MANPVLSRPDAFAPAQTPSTYAQAQGPFSQAPWQGAPGQTADGQAYGQTAYGQAPAQTPAEQATYGQPPYAFPPTPAAPADRMTIDDVLTKTALVLGATVVVAVLTWKFFGDNIMVLAPAAMVCGFAAFIIPLIGAFRRSVGPAFAFVYAVVEGVFLGTISGIFEMYYTGIVFQAVLATFVAAAATLAAFHFGKFRLTGKVQKILLISVLAYAAVALINFLLSLAGINLGLIAGMTGRVGALAWLFAGIGVVLAVICLVDDFQFIEAGIRQGAPAKTSWMAAYGLTVTMVFLYLKILRILSYLRR